MKRKSVIAGLLILVSCILLLMTMFNNTSKYNSSESISFEDYHFITKEFNNLQNIFSFNELNSHLDNLQDFEVLMLFVIDRDLCSSCINEISEYLHESKSYISSSLNDLKVRGHIFVLGKDSTDLNLVNRIIETPYSTSLVKQTSRLHSDLYSIKSGHNSVNKIMFINLSSNRITSIIRILSYSTEVYLKRNLIQDALSDIQPEN